MIHDRLQSAMLAVLYDAGEPLTLKALEAALRCTRRDLWSAVRDQHRLGNIKRGEPITLTASARAAIAAGRMSNLDWREAA